MSRFDEAFKRFTERTEPLHQAHRDEVHKQYRLDAETPHEVKEDTYREKTYPKYRDRWANAASELVEQAVTLRQELEQAAYGKPDPSYISSLVGTPTSNLTEAWNLSLQSGDRALQDSILAVARARKELGLVDKFVATSKERSAAKAELESIPDDERLSSMCLGYKPPRVLSLEPDEQAIEQAASRSAAEEASRAAFFNRPQRIPGKPVKTAETRGGRYQNKTL